MSISQGLGDQYQANRDAGNRICPGLASMGLAHAMKGKSLTIILLEDARIILPIGNVSL